MACKSGEKVGADEGLFWRRNLLDCEVGGSPQLGSPASPGGALASVVMSRTGGGDPEQESCTGEAALAIPQPPTAWLVLAWVRTFPPSGAEGDMTPPEDPFSPPSQELFLGDCWGAGLSTMQLLLTLDAKCDVGGQKEEANNQDSQHWPVCH